MADREDHADVPVIPPVMFGVPLLATLPLRKWFRVPLPRWFRRATGVLLGAAGAGLGLWSFWTFIQAKENLDVRTPTHSLMHKGPYRFTRNPIYLGGTLGYAGLGLIFNSLATVASIPLVLKLIERLAIEREEAYLKAKFGKQYQRYCDDVPRWL